MAITLSTQDKNLFIQLLKTKMGEHEKFINSVDALTCDEEIVEYHYKEHKKCKETLSRLGWKKQKCQMSFMDLLMTSDS